MTAITTQLRHAPNGRRILCDEHGSVILVATDDMGWAMVNGAGSQALRRALRSLYRIDGVISPMMAYTLQTN